MVPPRATREQLYQAYIVNRLPLEEIRQLFGYHWSQNVTQALKYYGISPRLSEAALRHSLPLNKYQRQIAIGTLLGDGYLKRPPTSRYAVLAMEHCSKQLPYLKWKLERLKPFASGKIQPHHQRPAYHGQTFSHPEFTKLNLLFYPSGKKIFPLGLFQELGPLAIAIWYMDDGSYKGGRSTLATCCFGFEATKMIAEWFTAGGMRASPNSNGDNSWVVGFTKAGTHALHLKIWPHVHPSMAYKLDPQLLPHFIPDPVAVSDDIIRQFPHLFSDEESPS